MDQQKLGIAKQVLSHLGIKPETLPELMIDDPHKRNKLENLDDRLLTHYDEESLWTMKTVRFLKDFSRYSAGVHLETSNKTFLRTAELFRTMGIKNYYFLLQLNNPLLKDVNPWDENLTDEVKLMVLQEAQENVWYILRELIKIDGRRFRANRAVISFVWSCLNHLPTLILMPRQSGKGLLKESGHVLGRDGKWIPVKDLKVGDIILAWDGTETEVTGLYENSDQQMYRITFADGRQAEIDSEHIWTVWEDSKNSKDRWAEMDTESLYDHMEKLGKKKDDVAVSIPLMDPDQVTGHKSFQLDPYLVGALLANGCGMVTDKLFRKPEDAVVEEMKRRTPKGWEIVDTNKTQMRFVRTDNYDPAMDVNLHQELIRLGISFTPGGKREFPAEYMSGSHAQRLMLLRGILDCKGSYEDEVVKYQGLDKELTESVRRLVWSLGNTAESAIEEVVYTSGEKGVSIKTYNLKIISKEPHLLFLKKKFDKKLEAVLKGITRDTKLGITKIEKLEELKDTVCLEVSHPDQLYVMDDWIVTHNTVGMQVMAFIMQYLIGRGFKAGLITLAASNRMQFVNALKKIRAGLPEYLINVTYKDNDAGNMLTYQAFGAENKNTFEVRVPSGGEDGAENVSRGSTFEVLLYDEPAWMKYIENIMNGAGPSTLTAQKNAREKGIPYFTAKATTPNSILKEEGKYMYGEMKKSTEWREAFFDSYSETHLLERVRKACPVSTSQPHICMQFNHLQLGFGKDWVKDTMDKLGLSWSKAKIDLLMMWTEEGKNKVFDDKTREQIANVKQEALWNEEIADTGLFIDWYYSDEKLKEFFSDPTEFFLMGMDTSDAVDRDACTLIIRRMKTGENVGIGRYPRAFLDDVTTVLRETIVRIPNSLLIIERNRAVDMIDKLLLTLPALDIDPFERIYNYVYQDPVKYKHEWKDVQEVHFKYRTKEFYLKHKELFGFRTGPETRRQMYGFIFEAVANTASGLRHPMLADELIGLETDQDGRIDHSKKTHDDLVIAWLLTYWFIKLGYNKALYGIPQGHTLTEINTLVNDPDKPSFGKDELELFIRIKDRIEFLGKELENTDNDIIARRIESEIKKLSEYVPRELRKTITVDEILANANKERNKRGLDKRFGRL